MKQVLALSKEAVCDDNTDRNLLNYRKKLDELKSKTPKLMEHLEITQAKLAEIDKKLKDSVTPNNSGDDK